MILSCLSKPKTKPIRSAGFSKALLLCLYSAFISCPTMADEVSDRQAISNRLEAWVDAFNTRNAAAACDIYARDLVAVTPESLQASREDVCARLAKLLSNPKIQAQYAVSIHEILVSGNWAVVRLTWKLKLETNGHRENSEEAGMDVFQHQPDGRWLIIRFMSFPLEQKP